MSLLPLDEEILPPSDDYIFKAMLTSPKAKPVLMDLISAVIGRKVVDVELKNIELPITDVEEKNERLDVNCVIDDGSLIDVEMQGTRLEEFDDTKTNFLNKSLYYATDLFSSQSSKGLKFYDLKRAYQITFSTYTIFPNREQYITCGNMRNEDGELISDQLSMIVVELSKMGGVLSKPVEDMTALDMWSAFLRYAPDPKQRELINRIIERKEEIGVAGDVIMSISRNPDEQAKYRSRSMIEFIRTSNLLTAEARGEARGITIGKEQGKIEGIAIGEAKGKREGRAEGVQEIARQLRESGIITLEQIAQMSGLSIDEINAL